MEVFLISLISSVVLLLILSAVYYCRKKDSTVPVVGDFIRRQYLKARFKIWDDLSASDKLAKAHQFSNPFQSILYRIHKFESAFFYYLALLFRSSHDSFLLLNCDRRAEECKDDDYPKHLAKQKRLAALSMYALFLLIIANISTGLITSFIFPNIFKTQASTLTHSSQVEWQAGTADANLDLTTSPGDIKLGFASAGYSATHSSQGDWQAGTASTTLDLTTSAGDVKLSIEDGAVSWTANGLAVANSASNEAFSSFVMTSQKKVAVTDGSGNTIITWTDDRNSNNDIYIQKINSAGVAQWTAGGVAIVTDAGSQTFPTIVADGSGGAIIVWYDERNGNGDLYAQKVDSSGTAQWTADGVAIVTAVDTQRTPNLISDGSGGAIIIWGDNRNGNYDVYAQKINSAGVVQWTGDGVAICTADYDAGIHILYDSYIVSDGSGGAIIAWGDKRGGGSNNDIYAQRVNSAGVVQWTADGVGVTVLAEDQRDLSMIADGSGGAILAWKDNRDGTYDIYAQKIDSSGVSQWAANGVPVTTAITGVGFSPFNYNPLLITDGSGGAIFTWADDRNGTSEVYAQKIDSGGTAQWTVDGVLVSDYSSAKYYPNLTADGSGGAVLVWADARSGNGDIYAQRLDSSGSRLWSSGGVGFCTESGDQVAPYILSVGSGAYSIIWDDSRSGNHDIYTQRIGDTLYYSGGVFTSPIIDAGSSVSWSTLSATETKPTNTDIAYETRTTASTTPYNMALSANGSTATSSSFLNWGGSDYTPDKAIDGIPWVSGSNTSAWVNGAEASVGAPQWLEIDLPSSQSISFVKASSSNIGIQFSPVAYEIQVWTNGAWNSVAASSTNTMAEFTHSFTATTTDKVRLYITQAYNNHAAAGMAFDLAIISEFEIYASNPTDPWSSWTSTTGTTVNSSAGRFLQYRATLSTTDTTVTPTLSAVTVSSPSIYYSSGMYTSAVLDNGNTVTWNSITAASTTPASTAIELAYRIGTTAVPDGTWSDWATTTGAIATSSQHLQYRAFLSTTDTSVTPTLASITLDYTSDIIPPTVQSVSPIANNQDIDISANLSAVFSEHLATSTVTTSSFTLRDSNSGVAGSVSYANQTATFNPTQDLECSHEYFATLTTTITDLAGNPMSANYTWQFMTSCSSNSSASSEQVIDTVITATTTTETATSTSPASDTATSSPASVTSNTPVDGNQNNLTLPTDPDITLVGGSITQATSTTPTVVVQPNLSLTQELQQGQTSETASILKQMLVDLGYLPKTTDTANLIFDEATISALQNFQTEHGISPTGVLGEKTMSALNRVWLELGRNSETVSLDSDGSVVNPSMTPATKTEDVLIPEPLDSVQNETSRGFLASVAGILIRFQEQLAQSETATATAVSVVSVYAILVLLQLATQITSPLQLPYLFINLLGLSAYRRQKKEGIVYDAETGAPVPLVTITIFDKKTGQAKETKVTDKYGAYFFLVPIGEYTLSVNKKGYHLLTAEELETAKTAYPDPYLNGKILSFKKDGLIHNSIPLERATQKKWHKILSTSFVQYFSIAVFSAGLIFSFALALAQPSLVNSAIVALYVVMAVLQSANFVTPHWGVVKNSAGVKETFAMAEALDLSKTESQGRTVTDEHGRYAFILDKGQYVLRVRSASGKTIEKKIAVNKRSIFGKNLKVS